MYGSVCVCVHVSKVYPYVPYSHNQHGLESTPSHDTRPLSEVHGLLSLLLKVTLKLTGRGQEETSDDDGRFSRPVAGARPRLGTSPVRKQHRGSEVAGVGCECGPGTEAVLSTVALELGTGQQEEQSPQGWRRRDIGPQEPGLPRVSAGAKLHRSCLGMVWKIPECSSSPSGTGLHPPCTQAS